MKNKITDLNLCLSILLLGYLFQWFLPSINAHIFAAPLSLVLFVLLVLVIIYVYTLIPNHPTLRRFIGRKWTLSLISIYVAMLLLIGLIPQDSSSQMVNGVEIMRRLGFYSVIHSYPFILITLCLLFTLGLVSIKYLKIFTKRGFVLSLGHIGLWLLLTSGLFGAGDYREYIVTIAEGKSVRMAVEESGAVEPLPWSIKLDRVGVEYYESGIASKYSSDLQLIVDGDKVVKKGEILVNSPMVYQNYYIYQSGFDKKNNSTILRVVYDVWLIPSKIAICMLIIAAFLMIFFNKSAYVE